MEAAEKKHTLEIIDRHTLKAEGITDTEKFEENIAVIYTAAGIMTVKGSRLKVSGLSLESGELTLTGDIDSISYGDRDRVGKVGFGGKLFR